MTSRSVLTLLMFFLVINSAAAQTKTYTNADLDKKFNVKPAGPEVYAALKLREYRAPAPLPSAPIAIVTNTSTTPWEWPAQRPYEPLSAQPFFYGLPYYYATPFDGRPRVRARDSERKQ